jgi:hypothetical protein
MAENAELTFERLLDWVEGRLSPAEAQQMEEQVADTDAEIQAQVRWLRAFIALGDQVLLLAPPPQVRAFLTRRFAEYAHAQQQPGFFQRLAAVLSFDSALQPAGVGARTGQGNLMRQFVFSTEVADIALNLQPRPRDRRLDILGQILPKEEELALNEFVVQLLRNEEEVAIAMADELGEFMLESLAPGSYQLLLSSDRIEIDLPILALIS